VWCKACRHQVEPDRAEMAERYGAEMTVPEWGKRLVCSQCGSLQGVLRRKQFDNRPTKCVGAETKENASLIQPSEPSAKLAFNRSPLVAQ